MDTKSQKYEGSKSDSSGKNRSTAFTTKTLLSFSSSTASPDEKGLWHDKLQMWWGLREDSLLPFYHTVHISVQMNNLNLVVNGQSIHVNALLLCARERARTRQNKPLFVLLIFLLKYGVQLYSNVVELSLNSKHGKHSVNLTVWLPDWQPLVNYTAGPWISRAIKA